MDHVEAEQKTIREYVEDIEKVAATLEPGAESCASPGEVRGADRSIRLGWSKPTEVVLPFVFEDVHPEYPGEPDKLPDKDSNLEPSG